MLRIFFLIVGLSIAIFALGHVGITPAYAKKGSEEDKNKEKPKPLHIKKKVLDAADIKKIDQAFKDGRVVYLDAPRQPKFEVNKDVWDAFMPYEPQFMRTYVNIFLQFDTHNLKSARHTRKLVKALVTKLKRRLKAAKELGSPTQVKIVENMLFWTEESFLKFVEFRITELRPPKK